MGDKDSNGKIEIRGLGDVVRDARKSISDLRTHTSGLRDDTRALTDTVKSVRTQVQALHEDLKFDCQTLGNGAPEESPSSSEKPVQGSQNSEEPPVPAEATTFRAEPGA